MDTREKQTKIQSDALDKISKDLAVKGKALAVAATGFGKGHLIKMIAERTKFTMIVIVPRVNLVTDLSSRVEGSKIFCASLGKKETGKITVGTIQSLIKGDISADIICLDEAHRYNEDILKSINARWIIGMTATPIDQYGFIYGKDRYWDEPSFEFTIADGIKNGFLCDYELISSKFKFDVNKYIRTKREYTEKDILSIIKTAKAEKQVAEIIEVTKDRKKVALICGSIKHAEKIKDLFIEMGEDCVSVHSDLNKANKVAEDWKTNDIKYCTSVAMISEGYDNPRIDTIALLRPTKSVLLMIQIVGRGLRLFPGKENCLILDYGHVFSSCGTPKNPDYSFILKGKTTSKEKSLIKECDVCGRIWEDKILICPACGTEKKTRDPESNLEESIFKQGQSMQTTIYPEHFMEESYTKYGQKFLTYKKDGEFFFLFGKGNYFKGKKKIPLRVVYVRKNGMNKVLKVDEVKVI